MQPIVLLNEWLDFAAFARIFQPVILHTYFKSAAFMRIGALLY